MLTPKHLVLSLSLVYSASPCCDENYQDLVLFEIKRGFLNKKVARKFQIADLFSTQHYNMTFDN
jgi:hypothetical protein